MSTSIESTSKLMITLIKATGTYVARRIDNRRHRKIYLSTLKTCIQLIEANYNSYENYKEGIDATLFHVDTLYKPQWFNGMKFERAYYTLACNQVLEIVESLYGRFETGSSDTDPKMFKNRGWIISGDDKLFG